MIAIVRYCVFMISVTAMSSPPKFKEATMTATTSSLATISNEDVEPFTNEIKKLHNKYRKLHGVQLFELDNEKISADARFILDRIYNNQKNLIPKNVGITHGKGKINEISDLNKKEAKKLFLKWYDTGANYDYDKEPSKEISKNAAPFTQIVWKNTKEIGIAISVYDDGNYDVLVTYFPLGNKKNHYKQNVIKPLTPK